MDLESQPFDLRDVVESALDLIAPKVVEKGLEIAYVMENDVPPAILGDVTRLRQILMNLLGNAVKFTEKGEIVLTVKAAETSPRLKLFFTVRDTGIGIPPDRMGRLFQSFSQADSSTTRKYGGTGLGLAISKRLTGMMGGELWAESSGVEWRRIPIPLHHPDRGGGNAGTDPARPAQHPASSEWKARPDRG